MTRPYFDTGENVFRADTDPVIGGIGKLNAAGGLVTIYTSAVKANSLVFVSHADAIGAGALYVDRKNIVPGKSFVVGSSNGGGNTDLFYWWIANADI